jgi:hypothetical protein
MDIAAFRIESDTKVVLVSKSVISTSNPSTGEFSLVDAICLSFSAEGKFLHYGFSHKKKKGLFTPLRFSLIRFFTSSVCVLPKESLRIFSKA